MREIFNNLASQRKCKIYFLAKLKKKTLQFFIFMTQIELLIGIFAISFL